MQDFEIDTICAATKNLTKVQISVTLNSRSKSTFYENHWEFSNYIISASAKRQRGNTGDITRQLDFNTFKVLKSKSKNKKTTQKPMSCPAWSTVKVKHLREGWPFVCWVALSGWILFGCLNFRVLVSFTLSHTERAIVHFTSNHVLMWKGKMTC